MVTMALWSVNLMYLGRNLVAVSSQSTATQLVTQCVAMNAKRFRSFALVTLMLFENSSEEMGLKFAHSFVHTDSAGNHLANEFF